MVASNPSGVTLKARDPERLGGEANGTITPGDVMSFDGLQTSGAKDRIQFVRNSTDGEVLPLRVATEYQKTGRGKDDDYSSGDDIEYKHYESGDRFHGFVFDGSNAAGSGTDLSSNANISAGDLLVAYGGSGQGGTFRNYDSSSDDSGAVLVEALEAVDNSSGSSPARIRLEVV